MTPEAIFLAGSISKPVSAMAALHLVKEGLLPLDANVNNVLRSWRVLESKHTRVHRSGEHPVVTLRGLLSHSAGFTVRRYRGYLSDRLLPTLLQVFNGENPANSKPVRVVQKPEKGFKYSDGEYLFFSLNQEIWRVDIKAFENLRPTG